MAHTEGDRVARDIYERLSPSERRERFVLSPVYRSAYNRALDSEDRMTLPRYFWRKWLPILGAEATALYVVLRDISRVESAASDSWCWPEQSELGRRVGVSKNTLRKGLATLEAHGFIRRERRRARPEASWGMVQGTNNYEVFLDIPLTPEDAVELLLTEMTENASAPGFRSCAQGICAVDNSLSSNSALSAPEFNSCTQRGERFQQVSGPEFKSCALNVSNVDNVVNVTEARPEKSTLREHPLVKGMSSEERRRRAALSVEIGDTLSRMAGSEDGGPHKSLGLHRRLAYLMPVTLVREALRTTRDAVDEQRAGRKTLRGGPSAYFAGIVFSLADREGIDLGVKRKCGTRPLPTGQGNHGSMAPGVPVHPRAATTQHRTQAEEVVEERPSDAERARICQILRGAMKDWDTKVE